MNDWSPEAYGRFRGLRLRPALDLLAQVGDLPAGAVVDLGCGDGAVGPALASRFPDRERVGVDLSPAMLAKAAETGSYHRLHQADLSEWAPDRPPALVFSNAALHWLGAHDRLIPRLAACLAPRGMLAVQMPANFMAPSHALLRRLAARLYPDRFDFTGWQPPVAPAVTYARLLSPLGTADLWETDYLQRLAPQEGAHPVRRFTESTTMRPFLDRLSPDEGAALAAAYDDALSAAYPAEADGSVLFLFRRLFLTVRI
jgi:trans-aconitate 2-methyltransferase